MRRRRAERLLRLPLPQPPAALAPAESQLRLSLPHDAVDDNGALLKRGPRQLEPVLLTAPHQHRLHHRVQLLHRQCRQPLAQVTPLLLDVLVAELTEEVTSRLMKESKKLSKIEAYNTS